MFPSLRNAFNKQKSDDGAWRDFVKSQHLDLLPSWDKRFTFFALLKARRHFA